MVGKIFPYPGRRSIAIAISLGYIVVDKYFLFEEIKVGRVLLGWMGERPIWGGGQRNTSLVAIAFGTWKRELVWQIIKIIEKRTERNQFKSGLRILGLRYHSRKADMDITGKGNTIVRPAIVVAIFSRKSFYPNELNLLPFSGKARKFARRRN